MNTPELSLQRIKEKKMYVIAAVIGAVTVLGILAMQNWNAINLTESWDSIDLGILETTIQTAEPTSSLFGEEEQPKFSIKEYLGYSAVERMMNQQ